MSVARAAVWMVGALSSFSGMAIAIRELSPDMAPFQILLVRSLLGAAALLSAFWPRRSRLWTTERPLLHAARNVAHIGGQACWIVGVALLPLAEAFALENTTPIWAGLFAILLLKERASEPRLTAMAAGAIGVAIILRPGAEALQPGALAMLAAAIAFAATNLITKRLTASDAPLTIVFLMTASQSVLALPGALWSWSPVEIGHLPWLGLAAFTGLSAHYCLSRALQLADALVVAPMEFLRLPLIALLGWALYGEPIELTTLLGGLVVFLGVWRALAAEARAPYGARR